VKFAVAGLPVTEGSLRPMEVGGKNVPRRTVVIATNAAELNTWRRSVRAVAASKLPRGWVKFDGPVLVECLFLLPPPVKGAKGSVIATEYPIHQSAGDVDKLARAVLDAMSGVVYTDDSRVIRLVVDKRYPAAGQRTGVSIEVRGMPGYPGGVAGEQLALEE
jgi:crossover junction endodeoxyribonuclease RusA